MHTLFVVPHTHWDREWHEPFQVFRGRLVKCIDKLLNVLATDPDYKYFLLDGQTIVLEDYLEVRPDREQILNDLISAGRLQVGPWYILPDEFLVSGEAIIRNLQRGTRIANRFGGTMRLGYIPDPFGHISQMPQILRGFGFDAAVFRRGLADEPTELWWQAPDGTRVLACYLRDSYDNAAWLPRDDLGFVDGVKKLRDSLAPHTVTENFLLMNGTDHMEPWQDLSRLMRVAQEQITDARLIHASLPMYVEQAQMDIAHNKKELQVARGELRNPKRHHLLPGVASMRMWIKQRNAHAQTLLEKWAEPFAAVAELEIGDRRLEIGNADATSNFQSPISNLQLLSLAWKYLLQNHPHDSICGCSVDETHADMVPRFNWVEQIANPIIDDSLTILASRIDTRAMQDAIPLVVFNPVAGPRTDNVNAMIELPASFEEFTITDDAGNEIPFNVLNRNVEEYYGAETTGEMLNTLLSMAQEGRVLGMSIQDAFIRVDENPIRIDVTLTTQGTPNRALLQEGLPQIQKMIAENPDTVFSIRAHSPAKYEIKFVARDVPGHGYKTFHVSSFKSQVAESSSATRTSPLAIENEFYRIEPNHDNGTVTIIDKSTGAVYRDANRFVSGGDRGDLYNYCPPENDSLISQPSAPPQIAIEQNAARQSLRVAMNYRLSARLTDDRSERAQKLVDEKIVTTISLYPGVHRIDFRTEVDNRARDHRLRVEFPSPIVTTDANVDQAFDVVTRSLDLPTDTIDWIEQPRPEAPMQNFVSISDGKIGLTLAARGLTEYAALPHSHTHEHSDKEYGSAGVTIALTLLRCVGWLSRDDLSTRQGHAGPAKETPGAQEIGAHVFEYALIPHAGNWRNAIAYAFAFTAPMRALATHIHPGSLPSKNSFAQASPREFIISAIKHSEEGNGLVVRGYNIGDEPIEACIILWRTFQRAARVNLNEEEITPVDLRDGRKVRLQVRGKEIVTLRFE